MKDNLQSFLTALQANQMIAPAGQELTDKQILHASEFDSRFHSDETIIRLQTMRAKKLKTCDDCTPTELLFIQLVEQYQ